MSSDVSPLELVNCYRGTFFSVDQGNISVNDNSSSAAASISVHLPRSVFDTVRSALSNESGSGAGLLRLTQGAFFTNGLFLRANESSDQQPQVDGAIVVVDFLGVEVSELNESIVMTFRKNTVR